MFTEEREFSKMLCVLCVLIMLASDVSFALSSKDATPVLTNFQVLERVSAEAAREIASDIGPSIRSGSVVLTKTKGSGDADFIIEEAFAVCMKEAGMRVTLMKPKAEVSAPDSSTYELSYRVVRLAVSYPRIWRRHWFGSRMVERSAQANVHAQLVDRLSGNILWIGESRRDYRDTIGYSQLRAVEEKQYEFTRPPREEFRWARIVEPVVVAGIITGLVYLFFSNQSNK